MDMVIQGGLQDMVIQGGLQDIRKYLDQMINHQLPHREQLLRRTLQHGVHLVMLHYVKLRYELIKINYLEIG